MIRWLFGKYCWKRHQMRHKLLIPDIICLKLIIFWTKLKVSFISGHKKLILWKNKSQVKFVNHLFLSIISDIYRISIFGSIVQQMYKWAFTFIKQPFNKAFLKTHFIKYLTFMLLQIILSSSYSTSMINHVRNITKNNNKNQANKWVVVTYSLLLHNPRYNRVQKYI